MSETFENELITCLAQYSAVFSSHIVDYFITLSWLQLPSEWRDFLTKLNSDQCFELLKAHRFSGLPASLHEFFNRCESLTIEHSPYWRDHPHTVTLPLPRELVLGNKKKRHEVSMLAKLITDMCRQHECPWVVDLGAGLSYLGLVLAHQFGLRTAAIESKRERCQRASARQEQLVRAKQQRAKKGVPVSEPAREPSQIFVHCIPAELPANLQTHEFMRLIVPLMVGTPLSCPATDLSAPTLPSTLPSPALPPFCLVALHACGDLSSLALRLFANLSPARTLCLVGCCYQLLTIDGAPPPTSPTPSTSIAQPACDRAATPSSQDQPLPSPPALLLDSSLSPIGFPLSPTVRRGLLAAGLAHADPTRSHFASTLLTPHVFAQATHSVDRLLGLEDSDSSSGGASDAESTNGKDSLGASSSAAASEPSAAESSVFSDPTRYFAKKRRATRERGGGPGRFARIVRMNHLRCALQLLFALSGHPNPKCSVGHLRDHTITFVAYARRAFAKLHWPLPRGFAELALPSALAARLPSTPTPNCLSAAEAFYRLSCRPDAPYWRLFAPPPCQPTTHGEGAMIDAFLEYFYAGLDENIVRGALTLRCLTSPLLESLVLADRARFLVESGVCVDVGLVGLFDRRQSPRGFAVVAAKKGISPAGI